MRAYGSLIGLLVGAVAAMPTAMAAEPTAPQPGKSAGDIMVRLRGIGVLPSESSDIQTIRGSVDLSNEATPEIDVSYFITDKVALELIAATTRHSAHANNTTLGNVDLGKVSLLPPTLTLQYHPFPKSPFSPYLGAGVNYTMFYRESAATGSAVTNVDYMNTFGAALQIGMDYAITDRWYANIDVKKLFISTDVKMNQGTLRAEVDIDPWIVGGGIGYKF